MIYKFNIAGPGSLEAEIHQSLFWGSFKVYINGKSYGKMGRSGIRKLIKLDNGEAYYFTLHYSEITPFSPPQVMVDENIVFAAEQVRLYEKISFPLLIAFGILLGKYKIPKSDIIERLLEGTLLIIIVFLILACQYYYYSSVRPRYKAAGRIFYYLSVVLIIIVLAQGIKAIARIIF
jgi:hypothetical protein